MQHRQAFKVVPSTPNFTVDSSDSPFSTLPADAQLPHAPSPPNFLHDPATRASPVGGLSSSLSGRDRPADGYRDSSSEFFANKGGEKYPPLRRDGGRATEVDGASAIHLPLLSSTGDDDDLPENTFHHLSRSGRGGRGPSGSWSSMFLQNARGRIHPLLLVPAFLLGIVLAGTGAMGPLLRGASRSAMSHLSSTTSLVSASGSPNYTLHPSGHLFVYPSALHPSSDTSISSSDPTLNPGQHAMRHPIHDLIGNATKQWEAKLARQSKTLEEAVREYKRRFGRRPPKGFDDWFRFAKDNDVILVDEFDQTFTDVLPFWALSPHILQERASKLHMDASTFTMVIRKGQVEIAGAHAKDGRAKDQAALMKRWAKWVPDVNITMSAHDGPSIMMDHGTRQKHLDFAKAGKLIPDAEADNVDEDAAFWGFPLACPLDSRLRRAYDGLEIDTLPHGPSYIADHLQTMNMCENPEWQYLHGFTSWPGMRPQTLRPLFSFAKMSVHSDLLLTPLEQYWDIEPWDPKWEDKPNNKAVWRGTTTGVWFDRGTWWRSSQRVRMWFMGKDKEGERRVRFSGEGLETPQGIESLVEKKVKTIELMDKYIDFAFTGKAGQCSEEDGSCDAVRKLFDFQRAFGWNEANEYKYMLDLDGNAWSGRFHRLLSTNSVVLKSTIFPEWYAGWIQPWVHYIPLKIDYTDLFDIMAFFAGGLDGRNGHDALAKQIAENGKEYATKYWRYADMEAYFFRLALEWARVSSPDRAAMDYTGPGA
ncbi:glycosyltransferase family 90 protein [Rhodotorula toruloides]|uniref:Glycosyltransferase family 90 protein n=1 Tax=Rhodotorula toruloides TaxID=5286 RepID=A0A511K9W3_RHOTO|nr:glycosyltransferase family 90 protein [Rhodotorula toruloides]